MCDINGTTVSVTTGGGSTMITVGTLDHRRRARFVVLFAAILAVTGCATTRREEAASTEQLLAAAGFQMRPADTPERVAALASMPREKLVVRSKDLHLRGSGEVSLPLRRRTEGVRRVAADRNSKRDRCARPRGRDGVAGVGPMVVVSSSSVSRRRSGGDRFPISGRTAGSA